MSDELDKIIDLNIRKKKKEIYSMGDLLPKVYAVFSQNLKSRLMTCFDKIDETLYDLSEKSDVQKERNTSLETMQEFKKLRGSMSSKFFAALKNTFKLFKQNNFDYFKQNSSKDKKTSKLSLSIVNDDELDETLTKTNLISKSDMAYAQQLHVFKQRFSLLASGSELSDAQVPVSPSVIVLCFAECLKCIELNPNLRLRVYKLFERNVMGRLNDIYSAINDLLAKNGILPDIKFGTDNNRSANNSTKPTHEEVFSQDEREKYNPESTSAQMDPNFQAISQMFDGDNTANQGAAGGNYSNAPNIDLSLMVNALTLLQGELFKNIDLKQASDKSPTEIKDELLKQLHDIDESTQGQAVHKNDEDTIDLVGMLFQFIVDDRNLPDAIQVILAKLQIPYLKIALQDRNLFADKNHSARVLLDKLSLAAVGWTEESDTNNKLINKIESVTHAILDEEEYNLDFFESLVADFDLFNKKFKRKADIVQRRAAEKTLGQEKLELAKKESAKILVEKMTNKQMPTLVRDILLGDWPKVLVLLHLREKQDSKNYQQKVKFIDLIIKYSQTTVSKNITKDHIEKLVKFYEDGLKLAALSPQELNDKKEKLRKCLIDIHHLDNSEHAITQEVEVIPSVEVMKISEIRKQKHEIVDFIKDIIEPPKIKEPIAEADDKYKEMVQELKTGTWMEFVEEGQPVIRAKLSWISPITEKYLFVNSRGLKLTDKKGVELAAGLQDGSIKILQQVPLFDRALSAIASKLKKGDKKTNGKEK